MPHKTQKRPLIQLSGGVLKNDHDANNVFIIAIDISLDCDFDDLRA